MNMDEFLTEMAEILEEDSVSPGDELKSFQSWDSLAALSVLAMADTNFGINISSEDVRQVNTVEDLYRLIITKKDA
jgi:acyl carrier protein